MSLSDDKWVRIMADYGTEGSPVWSQDGTLEDIGELPVSSGLRAALEGWVNWYDCDSDNHDLHNDSTTPWDVVAFASVGLTLARLVKRSLPDWTVIYFDEALRANIEARVDATAEEGER